MVVSSADVSAPSEYAVELIGINKTFPGGVHANKDVTLRIRQGEVHGLLGENGAGKTTLMNILYGLLTKDSGQIVIKGEQVEMTSPQDAIFKGVGMVHQHFKLIPPLTVAENVMLGLEPTHKWSRTGASRLSNAARSKRGRFLQNRVMRLLGRLVKPLVNLWSLLLLILVMWIAAIWRLYTSGLLTSASGPILAVVIAIYVLDTILPPFLFLSIDFGKAADRIRLISEENGMNIDPKARVVDLSVGLQQRVEIIKSLYRAADILILDEPTSVLTPQEVDELFVTLGRFKEQGKTIILITHKLREPMILCDRISVLRDGALVGTVDRAETSPEELARMMVGRPVSFTVEKAPKEPGSVVLSVNDLVVTDTRGLTAVYEVSLEVREGEILGIAGVQGNGQTELVEALVGLRKPRSGSIFVNGKDITRKSPRQVRNTGVSHIPEDRLRKGLILPFTIQENLVLGRHGEIPFVTGPKGILLDLERTRKNAESLVEDYSIKVSSVSSLAETLSGGNQQKMIVARELASGPKLLVASQPTRGLDVGATEYIHKAIVNMRDNNVGILLISTELDEILGLSDRIAVMFAGHIVAVRQPKETTVQELGLLMAGHSSPSEEQER